MGKLIGKPEARWFVPALVASVLLAIAIFLPLWKMELIAPQYPEGLVMYAYGNRFADDPGSYYDDVREINGLNHYIGMKPIEEVTEMKLFIPGLVAMIAATIAVSFVSWKKRWLRGLTAAGFWFIPIFFVADLQYWLYHFGHTMKEDAPLNPGDFTPKVVGTTEVWNFHTENSFQIGFYLMLMAALVITFGPLVYGFVEARIGKRASAQTRPAATEQEASAAR